MKKSFLLSLSVLSFFVGIAQENQPNLYNGINLNSYKLTDYRYLSLGTGLNTTNYKAFQDYNQDDNDIKENGSSNHYQNISSGSLNLMSIVSNRRYLGTQEISFGFDSYHRNSTYKDYYKSPITPEQKYSRDYLVNRSNFSLSLSSTNRFYLPQEFFCEVNIYLTQSPSYNYSKLKDDSSKDVSISNNLDSENEVELQIGHGRIENVTDARLAVYILDDLQKQGRLSRTLSQDEVFAFADFLTKTLNKRGIDSRIKRIKEYVAIDSFLVQNGLTTKTDGLYFGIVNDNRNYARTQTWNTGREWHFGVSPLINYTNRFTKTTDDSGTSKTRDELTECGLGFNAEYSSFWISGLKWQQNYSFKASFNVLKYDTVGTYFNVSNYKTIAADASYQISYLPNTRTTITGTCGVYAFKNLYKEISNWLNVSPYISSTCDYYFSEKLRFQANASIGYHYDKRYDPSIYQNTWNFMVGVGLQYYFY